MKRFLPDFMIIAILLCLPLGFFYQQTLGGKTLIPSENLYQYEPYATFRDVVKAPAYPHNHLVSDLILQNYQWKSFIRQQISIGEIPLWNPHQFGGTPFLAAGQHSALYPLSLIYYALDLPMAYGWFTVVNLWLAGVCMYGFMRGLAVSRGGAMLAGIVYQLCSFVLASVVFQMMIGGFVWLPLMLWMCDRIISKRSNPLLSVAVGAIALGMNILAGHAEITIYTLLITAYYSAIRLIWQAWHERHLAPANAPSWTTARFLVMKGLWLALMVGLGIGLGAIQIIPLFDFVRTNWRADRASLQTVLSYAHPVRDLLQFLMPNFYGNPVHHQYLDVFTGKIVTDFVNGSHTSYIDWGIKNYVESALYVGILPLLLAGYALFDHWLWRPTQRLVSAAPVPPYRLIFASLGALSLTFMFGLPTYALVYVLPGINQLNSPFRWIYALTVCIAVLAGLGLDALGRSCAPSETEAENNASPPPPSAMRKSIASKVGYGIVGIGVLIGVGLLASRVFYAPLQPLVERLYNSMANAQNAFSDAQMFYSYEFVNGLIFGVILTLSGMIFVWAGRSTKRVPSRMAIPWWQVCALVLVSVDLMIATWDFNPASDPELLKFKPQAVQWLQESLGEFRYTTLDDPSQRPLMQANSGWQYGLDDIRGYDSIISKPYVDYMQHITPQVQLDFNRIAPLYTVYPDSVNFDVQTALANPLLYYLNVRFIMSHRNVNIESDFYHLVYSDDAVKIWRVNYAFPRVLVCCGDTPQDQDIFERLGTGAVIDADHWLDFWNAIDWRVTNWDGIRQDSGREKFIDLTILDSEKWVVISENDADGWRAFVRPLGAGDDQETPVDVQRVNGIFQGVKLPVGEWTLRMVYSPASFQVGLFGSIVSVAIMTLLVGMWLWRAFVGVNSDSSSTGARVARNSIAPIVLNLFNRGIDFAFLLVMLRLLAPQEVGTYNYLVVVFVWFDIFTNFGLNLFLIREVSRDRSQAGRLFYNTSILRVCLVVVSVSLLLGYIFLRQSTVTPPLTTDALITLGLLYVGLLPGTLNQGISALFYAFEQAEKPAAIATITTINKAVFGVVVLLLGWGIVGLAGVSVFNNVLTLMVLMVTGRKLIRPIGQRLPDFALLRRMVSASASLLLNNFLATIFFQIDVVILEAYKGAAIVAKYSVSYKWILAINIIPSFFTQALLPVMSRQAHEDLPALKRTYTLGIKLMIALSLPMAVGFSFLAVPLTTLMGGQQYLPDGAIALMTMIWSIPIGWMNSLTQYALVALDLQKRITWAFFAAVIFNIVSNSLLIPQYSYIAAAITTIASELVLFIPFAMLMNTGLKERINWVSLLWRPVVATLVMVGVVLLGQTVNTYLGLFLGSMAYVAVLVALKPFDTIEREMFGKLLPARLLPIVRWVGLAT